MQISPDYFLRPSFVLGIFSVVAPYLILSAHSATYAHKLELANLFVQIVVAVSAALAFVTYYENKEEKKLKYAVDLISFFREKVISKQNEITKKVIEERGDKYDIPRVVAFSPYKMTMESIFYNQEMKQGYIDFIKIKSIISPQTNLLNSLDQFALCVRVYGLTEHPSLISLHAVFIQIVEQGGIQRILQHRVIGTGENVFSETLDLYELWKNKISRKSEDQRIAEFFKEKET